MPLTDAEREQKERLLKMLRPTIPRPKRKRRDKSACNKKRLSKKEAETILNFIKNKDRHFKRRKEVRAYQCPQCNCYHLTSLKSYK